MKKLNLFLVAMLISGIAFSQWNTNGSAPNRFGETNFAFFGNNNIRSIGIGHKEMWGGFLPGWKASNPPRAALHINAHFLSNSPAFTPGQVFRTDGPSDNDNMWQMFTGSDYNSTTEKGRFYVPANSNDLYIQACQKNLYFNAGGNVERMVIVGADFLAPGPINATVRNGNVGIATSNPLTKLHIGGDNSSNAGWRDWMDIGTLYSSDSNYFDNMYVGLRRRDDSNYDRNEAIINWGNNPVGNADFDRLRFVFTAATSLGIPASGADGLEVSRMISDGWNSRMGIGNFFTTNTNPKRQLDIYDEGLTAGGNPIVNGRPQLRLTQTLSNNINNGIYTDFQTTGSNNNYAPNSSGTSGHLLINPRAFDNTPRTVAINFENGNTPIFQGLSLDVNGQQNIRTVNNDDSLTHVLVWDPTNEGRIMWRDVSTIGGSGGVNAENGLNATVNPGAVQMGGPLIHDTEVQMENYNLSFSDPAIPTQNTNLFKFGNITNPTTAKFTVDNTTESITGIFRTNYDQTKFVLGGHYYGTTTLVNKIRGVYGLIQKGIDILDAINIGVEGRVDNGLAGQNYGVYGIVISDGSSNKNNYGGYFDSEGYAKINYGSRCVASDAITNYGIYTNAYSNSENYGIYATTGGTGTINYAGYFAGTLFATTYSSDIKLKDNILNIDNAMDIIKQLQPKTFFFKTATYPSLKLPDNKRYGLIAQDVEQILPELVTDNYNPPVYDTLGNIVIDSVHYKALEYKEFIPIIIQGMKEQQDSIEALQNVISTYETRFQQLEDMIATCCASNKSGQVQETDINSVIEINPDKSVNDNSVLYQNNPNPFNYKTTFNYKIGVDGYIELEIHDQYGNFITSLVSENQTAGSYSVDWNANDIAAGVYFYSLKVNGITWVKKAIKVR